jgi:hypothetical protein
MHRIVCNVSTGEVSKVKLTPEEIAEAITRQATYVPTNEPATPNKEQLMAELAALAAKIQSLE